MSSAPANADAIAYWNDEAGSRWAAHVDSLDRTFEQFDVALFAAAALQPGEVALDVGCGCGTTALRAADAVGTTGRVLGIDVSAPMLAVAEERKRRRGIDNADFALADASRHAFDSETFDVVFSRFGVMFFDDPVGAFTHIRSAIKRDGRLVFACWRDLAANPWFTVPLEAVRAHAPPQPQVDPQAPGPLAFANADRVRAILERGGFSDVRFDPLDVRLSLGAAVTAVGFLASVGPAARILSGLDERTKARALEALERALRANENDGDVRLGAGVWLVNARRAALAFS